MRANHPLLRTVTSRYWSSLRDPDAVYRDCNPRVSRAGSLSLGRYAFEVVRIHIPLRETKRKQSAPPKTSSPGETQWEITDATGHRPRHHQPN